MRKLTFFAVLFLFLLVPASITRAQQIESQNGVITARFQTTNGVISIKLPDDIRPGDVISGTLIAEPSGYSNRELSKNAEQLSKFKAGISDNESSVLKGSKQFSLKVPLNRTSLPLLIIDPSGKNIGQVDIKIPGSISPYSVGCTMPTHVLAGSGLQIIGPFDGSSENTKVSIGGQSSAVLAESPRQCVVQFPQEAEGSQAVRVSENGQLCSREVMTVNLTVTTGKLNLKKGESTSLDVTVTGLNGLKGEATLIIENITPDIVNISEGDLQVIPIRATSGTDGSMSWHNTAISRSAGNFSVDVNLDLPPMQADVKPLLPKQRKLEKEAILFGLSKAWKDAYTDMVGSGTKNDLEGCEPCAKCIQSTVDEVKVNLIDKLGSGIIETFSSKGIGMIGGWLQRCKKWLDKGMKAKDLIEALIKYGNLQVVVFEEKLCGYCLFSGIVFYETGTGCVEATFWCKGGPLCCNHADNEIIIEYCTDERGYPTGKPKVTVIHK